MTPAWPEEASAERRDVGQGHGPRVLGKIRHGSVGLVLWHRAPPAHIAAWLDALPPAALPACRLLLRPRQASRALREALGLEASGASPELRWLADDVAALVRRFAEVAAEPAVDVALKVVENDSCWRFHRDHTLLRLLTTYRGPGTQWVPAPRAEQALREQRAYHGGLIEAPRFAVALFHGALAPAAGAAAGGVVHRSPPIAGQGIARLLLRLGARSSPSPPPR